MIKEYVSSGKNVEIAIKNGLLEIGKNREDVDIKILETGGLFKKAKVILSYEVNEDIAKPSESVESKIENVIENKDIEEKKIENPYAFTTLEERREERPVVVGEIIGLEKVEDKKDVEKNSDAQENKEIPQSSTKPTKIVDKEALKERLSNFVKGLIEKFKVDGTVEVIEDENDLKVNIKGENVGKLIGYRGETLNAIQYLLGSLKERGESKIRVYLDIEGYKSKREETLIELANKMADKAEEIERNVHLDPMTPYERRIIHTALQNRTLVETESTGEGEKRHVVIKFKR